jgi:hypothetical protein
MESGATPEDKTAVAMHSLLKRLPGIEAKTITEKKKILVPASEILPDKTGQNLGSLEAETNVESSVEGGQVLSGSTIYNLGVPVQNQGATVEVETEVTRPVLDVDFVEKVKFSDRKLIGRLESLFFLNNPDITKRRQQEKWYKALSLFVDEEALDEVKTVNPASYKSHLVRLKTLFKMGLGFFVSPDAAWTKETPEVLHFWEQGKDQKIAKKIGCEVGESDPCKYVGKILSSFGLERDSSERVILSDGKRSRRYRLKPLNPVSQAIYDCVEARIMASIDEEFTGFDWNEILKKAPCSAAETPAVSSVEGGQVLSGSTIYNLGLPVQNQGEGSELEQLLEALPFCDSAEDFAAMVEDCSVEVIEDAIALQDTQPRRLQLQGWLDVMRETTFTAHLPQNKAEPVRLGQRVWVWIGAFRRWGQGVVSAILQDVSWDVQLEGEPLDMVKIYQRNEIESLGMSG